MKKILFFTFHFFLLASFPNLYAQTEEVERQTVRVVEVEGNKAVSDVTIMAKIKTKPGLPLMRNVLNEDIKALYALGYFTDVQVESEDYADGVKVIFLVKEKPVIKEIILEGIKISRKNKLMEMVLLKEGEFLNYKRLNDTKEQFRKFYQKKGFAWIDVEYEVEVDGKVNEAIVYLLVSEGRRMKVDRVKIDGNTAFSDSKIRRIIKTKSAARWLFRSGYFKKNLLEEDAERIKAFYRQRGYLDAVAAIRFEHTPRKRIDVFITVQEGGRYLTGEVVWTGNILFPETEIMEKMKLFPGQVFSERVLREDAAAVQKFYFERGYISAEVIPEAVRNPETRNIDIRWRIKENELIYVDKIKIIGNLKTKDVVVRRELKVLPGEVFSGKSLERSRQRLNNLGYFEEIAFDIEEGSAPNKKNIVVEVKETKTGEFSFGGGFSSVDRFIGFVDITQKNFDITNFPTFTGAGQRLRLRAELGSVRKDFDLSFTEPWIFSRHILFGFDAFSRTRERERDLGYAYDSKSVGGDMRLGRAFGEYLRDDIMFKLEKVDISAIPDDASAALKDEEGENTIGTISNKIVYDRRDNILSPKEGFYTSFTSEIAKGDREFYRFITDLRYYVTQFSHLVLELRGRAGIADGLTGSEDVPIFERFYAGGANTIRGFEERDVGPRDSQTTDPIGGNSMLIFNVEWTYPLVKHIKLSAFFDIGSVWEEMGDIGSGDYRIGVGPGVRIKTPFGPVKLDYGIPVVSQTGDEEKARFHFNISRGF